MLSVMGLLARPIERSERHAARERQTHPGRIKLAETSEKEKLSQIAAAPSLAVGVTSSKSAPSRTTLPCNQKPGDSAPPNVRLKRLMPAATGDDSSAKSPPWGMPRAYLTNAGPERSSSNAHQVSELDDTIRSCPWPHFAASEARLQRAARVVLAIIILL